ncbi:MAG: enoyl-CoA hydratase/carnithine racemase [Lysobacterales bacterium]|jgi:enoyl-CoA hydratase/carnithine racemase
MSSNPVEMNKQSAYQMLMSELSEEGILRLTLNDVKRRNALSEEMLAALAHAFTQAETDSSVRVIILAAMGPAFCAGHDLKQMTAARSGADKGKAYFTDILSSCSAFMQSIVSNPKPVIAEVTGIATAAGCQLVASCDLALAADTASFSTPGVHIGLFCSTPMVALSRNVSNKAAMEMLLTGSMVSAQKAEHIGLINQAVEAEKLTDTVMTMARTIASKSSMTLATGKKAFYEQREMGLADAYDYASSIMVENMLKHDAEEGINAFIQKRAPSWQDI